MKMKDANREQTPRRAHMFVLAGSGEGHHYPLHKILYLLSSPQYVNKIIVTVVCTGNRVEQIAKMKEKGEFGSLDLRLEELVKPAVTYNSLCEQMGNKPGAEPVVKGVEKAFESFKKKLLLERDSTDAPTCILSDMFYFFLADIAEDLKIPWYPLVPAATRYTYSTSLISNSILRSTDPQVRKQNIPDLEFARVFDFPPDVVNYPEFYAANYARCESAKAILVNDVEAWDAPLGTATALRDHFESKNAGTRKNQIPRVLLIGPIANIDGFAACPPNGYEDSQKPECLIWLDNKPAKSVLYIAFGTVINLTPNAVLELAHGLENAGVFFLWVLKNSPSESPNSVLPAGFQDRTKGRGFIETGFVPQSRILQHPSVCGFMSHCGWNSCMESICAGVPLITWPLSLDQPLNARFVVNVWKAGFGIKKADEDYANEVSREEVTKAIQTLMVGEEGMEVRKNVQKLKILAETAVKENGSSYTALHSFAEEIVNTTPSLKEI